MDEFVNIPSSRYIVINVKGNTEFRSFLLGHNVSIGTLFSVNYSPKFSRLVNITVRQKMLSLRKEDFNKIECVRIA